MCPPFSGGLTFFGAPLNTYMTHAACAMVRKLRESGNLGLLYGQGGFVTKHHALVLSREAPREAIAQDTSVQAEADRNRRKVPDFVDTAGGKGKVEAFTVIYRGNGEVEHGVPLAGEPFVELDHGLGEVGLALDEFTDAVEVAMRHADHLGGERRILARELIRGPHRSRRQIPRWETRRPAFHRTGG